MKNEPKITVRTHGRCLPIAVRSLLLACVVCLASLGALSAQPQPTASSVVVQVYRPVAVVVANGGVVDVGELPTVGGLSDLEFAIVHRATGGPTTGASSVRTISDLEVGAIEGPVSFELGRSVARADLESDRGLLFGAKIGSARQVGVAPLEKFSVELSFSTEEGKFQFRVEGMAPRSAVRFSVSVDGFGTSGTDPWEVDQLLLPASRDYSVSIRNDSSQDLVIPCSDHGLDVRQRSGPFGALSIVTSTGGCGFAISPGGSTSWGFGVTLTPRATSGRYELAVRARVAGVFRSAILTLDVTVDERNSFDAFFEDSSGRRLSDFGTEVLNADQLPKTLSFQLVIRNLSPSSTLSIPCSGLSAQQGGPTGVSGRLFEVCPLALTPGSSQPMDFDLTINTAAETGSYGATVLVTPEGGGARVASLDGFIEIEAACTASCPGPQIEIRNGQGERVGGLHQEFHDGQPEIGVDFRIHNKGDSDLLLDQGDTVVLEGSERFRVETVPSSTLIRPDPALFSSFSLRFDGVGADPQETYSTIVRINSNAVNAREAKFELRVAEFDTPYVRVFVDDQEVTAPSVDLGTVTSLPRSIRFAVARNSGSAGLFDVSRFDGRVVRGEGLRWHWRRPFPPGDDSAIRLSPGELYEATGIVSADHTGVDVNGPFGVALSFYFDHPGTTLNGRPLDGTIAVEAVGQMEGVYNPSDDPPLDCASSLETRCLPQFCADLDGIFGEVTTDPATLGCFASHILAIVGCGTAETPAGMVGCIGGGAGAYLCDVLLGYDIFDRLRTSVAEFRDCHCREYGQICSDVPLINAWVEGLSPGERAEIHATCPAFTFPRETFEEATLARSSFFPLLDCPAGRNFTVSISDAVAPDGSRRSCRPIPQPGQDVIGSTVAGTMTQETVDIGFECGCLEGVNCTQLYELAGTAEGVDLGDAVGVGVFVPELGLGALTTVDFPGPFVFAEAVPGASSYQVRITNRDQYPHCVARPTRADISGSATRVEVVEVVCDVRVPNARIVAPSDGEVVSRDAVGRVAIAVEAGDADGLASVQLFDAEQRLLASRVTAPYDFDVVLDPGAHTVFARATNRRGVSRDSEPVSFSVEQTVGCASGDSEAPAVVFQQPLENQRLTTDGQGRVRFAVGVADPSGVERVKFFVDGVRVATDFDYPYVVLAEVTPGTHTFRVNARDRCGNAGRTADIPFSVTSSGDACAQDQTLPELALIRPAEGAVLPQTVNGNVVLRAQASDASGIQRVAFVVDGFEVGSAFTEPYSLVWPAPPGEHEIFLRAVDQCLNVATTEVVRFTVEASETIDCPSDSDLPSVSIVEPASGATVSPSGSGRVRLRAAASDASGIDRVVFHVDGFPGAYQWVDDDEPFGHNWLVDVAGQHTVAAQAFDRCGRSRLSLPVTFTVQAGDAPVVSITQPLDGAVVVPESEVPVVAVASDAEGIERVDLYVDGQALDSDSSDPFAWIWTPDWGTHSVQARAIDALGATGWSDTVTVSAGCGADQGPPTVIVTQPLAGDSVEANANGRFTLRADAADSSGIEKVEFWVDGALLLTDTTHPFGYNWLAALGPHTVQAHAFDRCGQSATSPAVAFTVIEGGDGECDGEAGPPTVVVTLPAPHSEVELSDTGRVLLRAAGSDESGLERVEFWVDGVHVWSDSSAPYAHHWLATLGPHLLKARAIDRCGGEAWSPEVRFTAVEAGSCNTDSSLPEVAVTVPLAGAELEPSDSGRVLFRADASDDAGIDRVEFWVDGSRVWNDDTEPFAHNWLATPGAHLVRAKAFDACGRERLSQAVPFTVIDPDPCAGDDLGPDTDITLPLAGQTVEPSPTGRVLLRADAADTAGVERVEFWVDGVHVWTDDDPLYAHHWLATPGSHSVRARAFDVCGNGKDSPAVTFTVQDPDPCSGDTTDPTVAVTEPMANQSLEPSPTGRILMRAAASDDSGIDRVEFWVDGQAVWTDVTAPFGHNWLATPGAHAVQAKAFDVCGNERLSSAVPITVTDPDPCSADSARPTVAVTLPAAGAVLAPSDTGRVLLRADASDASGIDRVEFWVDGQLVWSDETQPYAHHWLATEGAHTLQAKAIDVCAKEQLSTSVPFSVVVPDPCAGDDVQPQVSITVPDAGAVLEPSPTGRVLFRASASDAGGIDRVEFYVDGTLVRTDSDHPYAYNWLAASGSHVVRAKAFDACNNPKWSAEVPFSVP